MIDLSFKQYRAATDRDKTMALQDSLQVGALYQLPPTFLVCNKCRLECSRTMDLLATCYVELTSWNFLYVSCSQIEFLLPWFKPIFFRGITLHILWSRSIWFLFPCVISPAEILIGTVIGFFWPWIPIRAPYPFGLFCDRVISIWINYDIKWLLIGNLMVWGLEKRRGQPN